MKLTINSKTKKNIMELTFMALLISLMIYSSAAIECNSSITFKNPQYSIKNSYVSATTSVILQSGFLGASGSFYYGAMVDGTSSVFSKEDPNNNVVWVKSIASYLYYYEAMALRNDETALYVIKDNNPTLSIMKINTADGSLISNLVR